MYESYYGLIEKPFSLTPDPKFLYRSPSHSGAFELLQYAIRRREGFVVITGDIGTGKTTLCRALLEEIDRTTFTALVLNPFLSEEDLVKRILQDFGVVTHDEVKNGAFIRASKQELIDALYDFLLGLVPLKACAVLIIDEAQNLPLSVLEQIRILSNLETDKEKLLQIILVGQLNLQTLLRSPELRQLDQRVSIRYQLEPLDRDGVSGYVAHRLAVAGGSGAVGFTTRALEMVHRLTNGIPRLINLICDRALLSGFSARTNRITPEMVVHAAESLDVQPVHPRRFVWAGRRVPLLGGVAVVLLASALAVGGGALLYRALAPELAAARVEGGIDRRLPSGASLTILVAAYPMGAARSQEEIRSMTEWLEASGFRVYYSEADSASGQRWQRVLAGAYTDMLSARLDADRLKRVAPSVDARVVTAETVGRGVVTPMAAPEVRLRRAGIDP
jgi:type II secretory pathway predicted ATPase ExeA